MKTTGMVSKSFLFYALLSVCMWRACASKSDGRSEIMKSLKEIIRKQKGMGSEDVVDVDQKDKELAFSAATSIDGTIESGDDIVGVNDLTSSIADFIDMNEPDNSEDVEEDRENKDYRGVNDKNEASDKLASAVEIDDTAMTSPESDGANQPSAVLTSANAKSLAAMMNGSIDIADSFGDFVDDVHEDGGQSENKIATSVAVLTDKSTSLIKSATDISLLQEGVDDKAAVNGLRNDGGMKTDAKEDEMEKVESLEAEEEEGQKNNEISPSHAKLSRTVRPMPVKKSVGAAAKSTPAEVASKNSTAMSEDREDAEDTPHEGDSSRVDDEKSQDLSTEDQHSMDGRDDDEDDYDGPEDDVASSAAAKSLQGSTSLIDTLLQDVASMRSQLKQLEIDKNRASVAMSELLLEKQQLEMAGHECLQKDIPVSAIENHSLYTALKLRADRCASENTVIQQQMEESASSVAMHELRGRMARNEETVAKLQAERCLLEQEHAKLQLTKALQQAKKCNTQLENAQSVCAAAVALSTSKEAPTITSAMSDERTCAVCSCDSPVVMDCATATISNREDNAAPTPIADARTTKTTELLVASGECSTELCVEQLTRTFFSFESWKAVVVKVIADTESGVNAGTNFDGQEEGSASAAEKRTSTASLYKRFFFFLRRTLGVLSRIRSACLVLCMDFIYPGLCSVLQAQVTVLRVLSQVVYSSAAELWNGTLHPFFVKHIYPRAADFYVKHLVPVYDAHAAKRIDFATERLRIWYMQNLRDFTEEYVFPTYDIVERKAHVVLYYTQKFVDNTEYRAEVWYTFLDHTEVVWTIPLAGVEALAQHPSVLSLFGGSAENVRAVATTSLYLILASVLLLMRRLLFGVAAALLVVCASPMLIVVFVLAKCFKLTFHRKRISSSSGSGSSTGLGTSTTGKTHKHSKRSSSSSSSSSSHRNSTNGSSGGGGGGLISSNSSTGSHASSGSRVGKNSSSSGAGAGAGTIPSSATNQPSQHYPHQQISAQQQFGYNNNQGSFPMPPTKSYVSQQQQHQHQQQLQQYTQTSYTHQYSRSTAPIYQPQQHPQAPHLYQQHQPLQQRPQQHQQHQQQQQQQQQQQRSHISVRKEPPSSYAAGMMDTRGNAVSMGGPPPMQQMHNPNAPPTQAHPPQQQQQQQYPSHHNGQAPPQIPPQGQHPGSQHPVGGSSAVATASAAGSNYSQHKQQQQQQQLYRSGSGSPQNGSSSLGPPPTSSSHIQSTSTTPAAAAASAGALPPGGGAPAAGAHHLYPYQAPLQQQQQPQPGSGPEAAGTTQRNQRQQEKPSI